MSDPDPGRKAVEKRHNLELEEDVLHISRSDPQDLIKDAVDAALNEPKHKRAKEEEEE